mgnify:CR=1 FL=1
MHGRDDGAIDEARARLRIRGPLVTSDAGHGDSIAVNGVCLTVTDPGAAAARAGTFTADVMAETLRRSSLGALAPGSRVNLERPMALGGRLDGHLVQGHVDGTGTVLARTPSPHWEVVRISLPADLARYVVEKGSITVDGTSLTVSALAAGDEPAPAEPAPAPQAGTPAEAAQALIETAETDRGFYAGAVGWCDSSGDGEYMVAIRCAEVAGDGLSARAWAGGGIVGDSDAQAELEETTAKLRTILKALSL